MRTRSRRLSTPDPHSIRPTRCSSGNGPERALEAIIQTPSRTARKSPPPPSLPASAGPFPQSHHPTAHLIRKTAINPTRPGPTNPETSPQKTSAPEATQPAPTPAAAGPGRSEPWRRTKPFPRAAARKLILPRASLASVGAVPRSAPTNTPIHPHPLMDRGRTPGQETRPTRDNGSQRAQAHPIPGRSGVRPERALEANTPTHRAQRESSSFPEPPQRAQA